MKRGTNFLLNAITSYLVFFASWLALHAFVIYHYSRKWLVCVCLCVFCSGRFVVYALPVLLIYQNLGEARLRGRHYLCHSFL